MEYSPLITGVVCYLVGLIIGVYSTKGLLSKKVASALKEGKELGLKEAEEQSQVANEDLSNKLSKLQQTLLDTLDAYEDTVKVVNEKFQGDSTQQLSLEYQPTQRALPSDSVADE